MDARPSSLDPIPSPIPVLATSLGPGEGLSSSGPPKEIVLLGASASPGPLSTSSGDWLGEAARVEEGWIAVKRNKSKPSLPPVDMFLRSGKGVSKSKGKL